MHLERIRPTKYRITLHSYELAALISAARWITDGAEGELTREATEQLKDILTAYDTELKRINKPDPNEQST
ncbi:hypothetical protein NC796_24445 [Aliifodinibius sp. S!AR15-10]|uniref:hypothetical protein n=1 Tax=Aliifodinibius sp. S!AR15-10 TaxID=2950437 RepID=UPI0028609D1F|nr:hypothetical protein [Aliifodinibius sp. S!AR15-10]MDR8394321.1 hypothetical protein [Aliifodinibius sp. S!AR15-10]